MQWLTRGRGRGSRGWQACPATLRDSAGHSLAHPLATRSALRKGGGAPRRAAVTLLVTAQEGKGQSPRAGANPGRARTAKRNSLRDRRVGIWKRHGHKRDGRGERGGGGGNGANNRPLVDEVSETVPSVVSCTAGPTPPVASVGSVPARRHTTSAVLPSIDGLAGGDRRWWPHSPRAIVALAAASAARCSCAQLGGAAPCWDDPPPHAAAAAAAAVCRCRRRRRRRRLPPPLRCRHSHYASPHRWCPLSDSAIATSSCSHLAPPPPLLHLQHTLPDTPPPLPERTYTVCDGGDRVSGVRLPQAKLRARAGPTRRGERGGGDEHSTAGRDERNREKKNGLVARLDGSMRMGEGQGSRLPRMR